MLCEQNMQNNPRHSEDEIFFDRYDNLEVTYSGYAGTA
jgi:hypothetical protein